MSVHSLMLATTEARTPLSDRDFGVHVKYVKFQIVRVTYPTRRQSKVEPLSQWLSLTDAVAYLKGMQCES